MLTAAEYEQTREALDAFESWRGNRSSYHPDEIPPDVPRVTNEQRSAVELYEFNRDKPESYFAYVRYPNRETPLVFTAARRDNGPAPGSTVELTTWTGELMARGRVLSRWRDNFGSIRVAIRVECVDGSGVEYSGTAFYSAGDYARIRRVKQPAPVYFHLIRGMRGVYQADESRVELARTFREFSAIVESERREFDLVDARAKRAAWAHLKRGKDWREMCVAFNHGRSEFYARGAYGLTVSSASESEWREQSEESES